MYNLRKSIIFVLIVIIPIIMVNYYVDSYASFRVTYNDIGMVSIRSNYCTGTDILLSERKAKWGTLRYLKPVQSMILGSSRSMQFSKENLEIESFYNLSVSAGCSVQDYMAEIYILEKKGLLPDYLLIEVSPSIFNCNAGNIQYTEWGNNYEYMRMELAEGTCANYDDDCLGIQIKDIISPAYFQYNFQQLIEGKRAYIVETREDEDDELSTQRMDGSYAYSREYQQQNDVTDIEESISSICNSRSIYRCDNYRRLDKELVEEFEELVFYLSENHDIKIAFYLPPYSEYMYDYICCDENYYSILEVEEYILDFARKNDIQVYGSYDPKNSHLELNNQYDAYHIKSDKIRDTLWIRFDDLENHWNCEQETTK